MTYWAEDPTFTNGPRTPLANKVTPSAAQIAEGLIAGGTLPSGQLNWFLNYLDTMTAGIYGDGSDGNVTIAGTVTLTRDMFYDNLIVPNATILDAAGFRVFVRDVCDVQTGGLIRNNGIAGEAGASGDPGDSQINTTIGSMGGLLAHITAVGVTANGPGTSALAIANGLGGVGGAGGNVTFYAPAIGGAGGVITAPPGSAGGYRSPVPHLGMLIANTNQGGVTPTLPLVGGSAGGSGGSGGNNSASGSSGGPGGLLALFAHSILLGGRIECEGGVGGAAFFGGVGSDSAGGSGGGGGGVLWVTTRSLSGAGALSVDGGLGSAGAGPLVTAGAQGGAGLLIQLVA